MRDVHCYAIDSTVGRLFGRHFYGVRLQPLEDGYGWVVYGHPPARRIVAAYVRRGSAVRSRNCAIAAPIWICVTGWNAGG